MRWNVARVSLSVRFIMTVLSGSEYWCSFPELEPVWPREESESQLLLICKGKGDQEGLWVDAWILVYDPAFPEGHIIITEQIVVFCDEVPASRLNSTLSQHTSVATLLLPRIQLIFISK